MISGRWIILLLILRGPKSGYRARLPTLRPFPTGSSLRANSPPLPPPGKPGCAAITNLQLSIHLASPGGESNLLKANLFLVARRLETKWGGAENSRLAAQWTHMLGNTIPLDGTGQLEGDRVQTRWGNGGKF